MNRRPFQIRSLQELIAALERGLCRICLTAPTGAGKSIVVCDLILWAVQHGLKVVLYTNRRGLIHQLSKVLDQQGIVHGVRAAGHQDQRELPVQISSLPTERSRVLNSKKWQVHGHGEKTLAIVDEAHLNAGLTAQAIINKHIMHGGAVVGVTATPIGIGRIYHDLIIGAKLPELYECGALVRARHYGPDLPDMKQLRANSKTGEFSENQIRKVLDPKVIFGRVLEHYQKLNPTRRPTILFAPGVKESIWFAEHLTANGIRAAHIDGDGIWANGEYVRTKSQQDRDEIFQAVRCGAIEVVCNRFVLREGIDLPELSHAILATIMGSLATYLQAIGRTLRACEGKAFATIQDHGGNCYRHGDVNSDREWNLSYTESHWIGMREDALREKRKSEPIACVKCNFVRNSSLPKCPECGYESTKKSRLVIQTDGTLKEQVGDYFKSRYVCVRPSTERIWISMYHRAKNSKNRMNFNQARGLFAHENHYWLPRNLPLMPQREEDWYRAVCDVPNDRLIAKESQP